MDDPDPVAAVLDGARVLPVLVLDDAAAAAQVGAALAAGGLSTVEVTLRTGAATDAIRALVADAGLTVGAGTVLGPADVDLAVAAGATFVVSPGLSLAVVHRCRELGVPVLPGVATPTEIQTALAAGLRSVKLFPARELGGPAMVKALAAPFRTVRFVPTGGVGVDNLAAYLAVPAVLAVGGTWLAPPDLIAAGDWTEITRRTADAVRRTEAPRPVDPGAGAGPDVTGPPAAAQQATGPDAPERAAAS